ncbi:UDP-N-acetylglucosamine 2-epimerase [Desulfoluna butyratoxydans]|nr:UDP-N-acetylglucosamine 2-epimerase [Desulfoluna butyratoxydans]
MLILVVDDIRNLIPRAWSYAMIHFFIGTKAQFIKVAPVIGAVSQKGMAYRLIDSGQHSKTTADLMALFHLPQPDAVMNSRSENIDRVRDAMAWFAKDTLKLVCQPGRLFNHLFNGKGGVCVVHGDTLTTLLSILCAKRCGLKVVHIESGLRSYDWLNPFPEEMIRLLSMKLSDYLIAPSGKAYGNLCDLGYRSKSVLIEGNTGKDAALEMLRQVSRAPQPVSKLQHRYTLVTIHRAENIYHQRRLKALYQAVLAAADKGPLIFVLHDPTVIQLKKYGMLEAISNHENITCLPLQPYDKFIELMVNADCVMTDGGSIQEECSYFNIPCIILRSSTERDDGLGKNAVLAKYDIQRVQDQLNKKCGKKPEPLSMGPVHGTSRRIADFIISCESRI